MCNPVTKAPVLLLAFMASAPLALATDFVWKGNSADWSAASEWTPAGPPSGGAGNFAIVDSGTAAITSDTGSVQDIFVGRTAGADGTVNHSAGTVSTTGWMFVGINGGKGTYNMTGSSSVATGNLFIGGRDNAGSNGSFNVDTTGTLAVSTIRVADNDGTVFASTGAMTITSGTVNSSGEFQVGRWGGVGTVNQTGGTVNVNGGWFGIANDNPGSSGSSYSLSGGALNLNATVGAEIGADTGGSFNLSGTGVFNTQQVVVGFRNGGNGVLTQTGGTVIARGGDSRIGSDTGSQGLWSLSGGDVNMSSNFQIGASGIGRMNVTGGTVTNSGWMVVGRYNGGNGTLDVSSGQILHNNNGSAMIIGEEGTGTLNISGDALVNVDTTLGLRVGHTATGNGTVNLNGGTLAVHFIQKTDAASVAKLNLNGGTLKALASSGDFLTGFSSANVEVQAGGAKIDTNGNDITIRQGLAGNGGLTKLGAGVLTLEGTSTFSGLTTVSGGTLNLAVGSSLASAVTVEAGASLTGNGSATGAVTITGQLAPGNSIGQLNFAGDLTLDNSSTSVFELDNTAAPLTADLAVVGGALTYGGSLSITGTNFANGDVFNLFDFGTVSGSFGAISYPAGTTASNWVNNLSVDGTLTFVPEPGSSALLMLALAGLTRRRRNG